MPASETAPHDQGGSALAEFKNAPVVEVAASVQFAPLKQLNLTNLVLLWNEFRSRYPRLEFHPPLVRLPEGLRAAAPFELIVGHQGTQPSRLWFIAEPPTALVQVQRDRVVVNWRKLDTDEPYRRYHSLVEKLRAELLVMERFLEANRIGHLEPDYIELTYVNHVAMGSNGDAPRNLSDVLSVWRGAPFSNERVAFEASYTIPAAGEASPPGELQVTAQPRVSKTRRPLTVLQLIGRASLEKGAGLEGCFRALDEVHKHLIDAFVRLTTPAMHSIWERVR